MISVIVRIIVPLFLLDNLMQAAEVFYSVPVGHCSIARK